MTPETPGSSILVSSIKKPTTIVANQIDNEARSRHTRKVRNDFRLRSASFTNKPEMASPQVK